MPSRAAEVVVVGAGVVGASIAYHLAARGCRDVLVLDRAGEPGGGSTARATGGFRAQFETGVNVRLSLLAREKLLRFPDELGASPGYLPHGYLFFTRDPGTLARLRAALAVQHAAGLHEAREVTPAEIVELNPALRADDLLGGTFCPSDGFIAPLRLLHGYLDAARRLGARFAFGTPARGLRRRADRIEAVHTPDGPIAAGWVVNAAGAWAGEVGRWADVEIPVRPLRRQVAVTTPCTLLPAEMPMTIDADDGFHLRVRDGRVLLLWPDPPPDGDPYDTSVDDAWVAEVERRAHARVPRLAAAVVDRPRCWAGLYEMTPDGHALLGCAPGVENLLLANGSSGHGVMHAPALGQLVAELVLDGRITALDARALRPDRFTQGLAEAPPVLL